MRQVQLHEEEEQFASLVAEAEAGQSLTILRAGRPVAQIIPFPVSQSLAAERRHTIEDLRAIMDAGHDLGGLRIDSRDELYDRD